MSNIKQEALKPGNRELDVNSEATKPGRIAVEYIHGFMASELISPASRYEIVQRSSRRKKGRKTNRALPFELKRRIELTVVPAMKFSGALSLLVLAGASIAPATIHAATADHRFGAMTHFAHGWDPVWADIAALRGIKTVRDELYWDAVEREQGVFAFPRQFDAYMDSLRRNGIAPLIVLSFENRNYDDGDTPHTTEAISAFGRYGTEVLKRYGEQIQTVEIWNEYNGTFCKGPATANRAGTYATMLREAYAQIKKSRPEVTVLGGATAGIPMPYWEKLMQNGALASMDALSIHPYRYEAPPEGIEDEIVALQELVRKYNNGESKPIWVTEIGWGTQVTPAPGALRIDEATQARFLVRAYALLLSANVERVYWYLFRDYEDFTMGLTTADARPKLAAFAMQVMVNELTNARFVRREATTPGLYSMLFVRPSGEEVRVVWSLESTSLAADGATRIVDLEGRTRTITSRISVDDSPLFISGQLAALPPPPNLRVSQLADARTGFSGQQGGNNWSFGERVGADPTFRPLPNYTVSDWNAAWGGAHPYLSITPGDQHPSATGNGPVTALRRWTSDRSDSVRIVGEFRCSTNGDGVGVSVLVNGQRVFQRSLGGGHSVSATFDLEQNIAPGTTIDFAVDPGPGTDISYDATQITASIRSR